MYRYYILILVYLISVVFGISKVPRNWLGVPLHKRDTFDPAKAKEFTCVGFDGNRIKLPWTSVNDDYCDCADGTDEPGTSACENGVFTCLNEGYIASEIPSSRVSDGVCEPECCDGSDEQSGIIVCPNTCAEKAKEHQKRETEKQLKLDASRTILRGYKVKVEEIKESFSDKKISLAPRLESLKSEVAIVRAQRDQVEQVLQQEREKLQAEEEKTSKMCFNTGDFKRTRIEVSESYEAIVEELNSAISSVSMLKNALDIFSNDMEILGKDPEFGKTDRVRALMQGWVKVRTVLNDVHVGEPIETADNGHVAELFDGFDDFISFSQEHGASKDVDVESFVTVLSPAETACSNATATLFECVSSLPYSSWYTFANFIVSLYSHPLWSKIWDTASSETVPEDSRTHESSDFEEMLSTNDKAETLRAQVAELENEIAEIDGQLASVQQFESTDYGQESLWFAVKGECVSYDHGEYVYEVCFHDKAVQKARDGRETSLGNFERFGPREPLLADESNYNYLYFSNGEQCWNGPRRSMQVHLQCGPDTKILSVSEPSKCEYSIEMESPFGCNL